MTSADQATDVFAATGEQIDALHRDAERWRFYAKKVAALLGISLEEMSKEIDQAIEYGRTEDTTVAGSNLEG